MRRLLTIILAFLLGSYMLFNGIYVMQNGKYFGSDDPGPWVDLFINFGIDIFKLGPMFIAWGLVWLYFVALLLLRQRKALIVGLIICILTLWYMPIGTVLAVIMIVLMLSRKRRTGLLRDPNWR